MSRLTFRDSKGELWIKDAADIDEQGQICMLTDRLAAYEDIEKSPEEIISSLEDYKDVSQQYSNFVHEMQPLKEAKADGRLVVLPCKVGDAAWKIKAVFSYYSKPMEDRVDRIIISDKEILVCCTSGTKFSTDSIGKTVFLTRAEAEEALKEAQHE